MNATNLEAKPVVKVQMQLHSLTNIFEAYLHELQEQDN